MKRYKCKKPFCVDKYDDDGFMIENSVVVIDEGKFMNSNEPATQLLAEKFILILLMMARGWKLQKGY